MDESMEIDNKADDSEAMEIDKKDDVNFLMKECKFVMKMKMVNSSRKQVMLWHYNFGNLCIRIG